MLIAIELEIVLSAVYLPCAILKKYVDEDYFYLLNICVLLA